MKKFKPNFYLSEFVCYALEELLLKDKDAFLEMVDNYNSFIVDYYFLDGDRYMDEVVASKIFDKEISAVDKLNALNECFSTGYIYNGLADSIYYSDDYEDEKLKRKLVNVNGEFYLKLRRKRYINDLKRRKKEILLEALKHEKFW